MSAVWKWSDDPETWEKIASACRARGILGCDTETYGHNVKESTPAYRASIDVWSLSLSTGVLHPYGYHIARACVLPLSAAQHPALGAVLASPDIIKVFHNAHHDQHAFANHGIRLGRVYDTLDAVRLMWPGRDGGYSLKPLRVGLLGKPAREGFKELTEPQEEEYSVEREVKACVCGVPKCRKSKAPHGRTTAIEHLLRTRKVACPIESILPGHARWDRKLDYAGDDAADALELYELIQAKARTLETALPDLPWD